LNHFHKAVSEYTLIVSFNVVHLYTNIQNDYGIEVIKWLENFTGQLL